MTLQEQIDAEREEYRRIRRLLAQASYLPAVNRQAERAIRRRILHLRNEMRRCQRRGEALAREIEEARWTAS